MMVDEKYGGVIIRPYEALCAVCSLCDDGPEPPSRSAREFLEAVKRNPDMPVTLRCDVGDVFSFQDIDIHNGNECSIEFERKRDLEILYRLNFVPGITVTARILLHRIFERIETVQGICGFDEVTSDAWVGCPRARGGYYERARALGIEAIIPQRNKRELQEEKRKSLAAMYAAKRTGIRVRPHLLLCAVCQYGRGIRPPFEHDNLPELIDLVLKEPDTLITLVEGADWMMCAPCPNRSPHVNACVNVKGSGGLTNQLRDLRTLQKLGLTYGATLNARELFKLVLTRIPSTVDICRFDSDRLSVWWDPCGERRTNSENYAKGRKMLMDLLCRKE